MYWSLKVFFVNSFLVIRKMFIKFFVMIEINKMGGYTDIYLKLLEFLGFKLDYFCLCGEIVFLL